MLQLLLSSQSLNKLLAKLAHLHWLRDCCLSPYEYKAPAQQSLQPAHLHPVLQVVRFLPNLAYLHCPQFCKQIDIRRVSLYLVAVIFIAQFILVQTAVAAAWTHPFTAHMMVGGDETPPTTPAPIGATAISANQIDLVWGVSTDDTALAGYRVFRDMVQIATTTLTTFSDTGLIPETSYTYNVDAFDIFYNFSTSSDFATATTLVEYIEPPVLPPAPDKKSPGSLIVVVDSMVVTPHQFSAKLEWTTNVPTSYVVRWGRTDSYELGSVHGGQYLFEHSTVITDLEIATKYFYEIEALSGIGGRTVSRGEFTTTGTIPAQAVSNVLGLRAHIENDSVRLRWNNPTFPDFSHVRIVRSHLFYPLSVTDGRVMYEGGGESFFDDKVFLERPIWYYAIFVYDKNGRISSGATVRVEKGKEDGLEVEVIEDSATVVDLFAMNVALSQGRTTSYLHNPEVFSALEPLFVSIPINAVPRHLKSIIVTVTQPGRQNESSSYLLKINPAGTAYETLIPPAQAAGLSRMTVKLYNYELATIREVSNTIEFEISPRSAPLPWWMKALITQALLIGFLLLVLVLILFRWWEEYHQRVRIT